MTINILVIDDNEDDRHLYRRTLRNVDCRVVMASTAKEGLICMADLRPDAVLLDYNLPDMDGLSFIKVLAECSGSLVPVIMLTGEGSESVAVEAIKSGADDYLVKDTAGQYLRLLPGVIGRAMASHAQREQNRRLTQETAVLLRRNQELMRNSADGIHVMDCLGNILEANDAFCRMLGYSREEMSGLNVADWDAQCTAGELREKFLELIGTSAIFETLWRRKDGTLVNAEVSVSCVEMEGQIFMFASARDISERKKSEAMLRQHKRMIDASIDGFWVADIRGNLLEANEAYARMSGYAVEELVGMHISQVEAIEQSPAGVLAHIEKVIATGQDRFETRHRRKDGREIDVEVSVTYLAEPQRMFVFCRDITERKKSQQALVMAREEAITEKQRLEAVMQNLPVGVAIVNAQGGVILSNTVFEQIWGSPRPATDSVDDYIAYKAWWADTNELVQPEEWASARAVLEGETVSGQLMQIQRFDGARAFIMNSGVPLRDTTGCITGCAVVIQDVTAMKHTEEALREADRHKDEFLAMLAHELRNPLAPIRNAAHVIGQPEVAEDRIQWAHETIERQVAHLTRLVDDLLDVSRIARGKITLKREAIDFAALAEQVMQVTRPLAEGKGHRLTVRLPEERVRLEGDLVRLSQVLFNLLDNAIKYTSEGGQIEFAARMAGAEIEISVRDNGMGIRADLLPRVFDMFQQDERKLDRAHGGLGIGLTLVQRLVGMHGGRVEAHSAGPGQGSTFTIRLPARVMSALPAAPETRGQSRPAASMRVLVVEDDHAVADSTAVLLEMEGHEARIADSGHAALEQIPEFRPQVVLLDIGLKGMDGFETAQRLRQLPEGRDLHLVAVTGYAETAIRERALASGCDHFLVKPVTFKVLNGLLSSAALEVSTSR